MMSVDSFRHELVRLRIDVLRKQHNARHINLQQYEKYKQVDRQLKMWIDELDNGGIS